MDLKSQLLPFGEDDIDMKIYKSLSPYKNIKFEEHDDVNFKKENDTTYNSCCFSTASFAIVKDELNLSDQEFDFDIDEQSTNSSHLFKDEIIISDNETVNDYPSISEKNGEITKEILCKVSVENIRIDNNRKWNEMEADSSVDWVENSDSDEGNSSSRSMYPEAKKKWIGWNHKNGLQLLNYFKCTNCSSVFNSWQNFDAHIRMNKNALLVCSYCNFHASTTCGIYSHMRSLHNLNVFRIAVDYSQSLAEREQSNNFNRKFSGASNNSARFDEGLMTSSDANEGLNFLKSGKQENQNYDLGRYSKFFESILYLGNEDSLESNEFRCCFCLCISPNLVTLKVHMNRDHLTPEPFECENCHFSRFFPSFFIGVVKSLHSCKESESEHFLDEITKPRTEKQINKNSQIEYILANTDINSPKNTSNIFKQQNKSKCGLCEFLPRGTKSIISHMLAKHTILKLFKCFKCDHIMYYPLIVFDKVELLHECRNLKLIDLTTFQNNKCIHLEKNLKSSTSTHSSNCGMKRLLNSSNTGGANEQTNGLENTNKNENMESEIYMKTDVTRKNEETESACDILWEEQESSEMDVSSIKTMTASESEDFPKLESCDIPKESLHHFIYFPDEFQGPDEKILSWDDSTFDFSEDELKDPEKDPLAIEEHGIGIEEKDTTLSNSFEGLNFSKTEEYDEIPDNVPSKKIMCMAPIADAVGQLQWRRKRVFDFSFDVLGITSRGLKLITEFHECQSCEMTFYNKMEYYKHVTNHGESENTGINKLKHNGDSRMDQSIRCERCDFTASSMASMRWHKVKYHSTGIHYFSCCPFCSYIASSNRKMSEHIHLDHSCGIVTKCFFCEHSYTQILCTHNHRASHDLNDDQAYICELCKHYSFSKEEFLLHVYNFHKDREL